MATTWHTASATTMARLSATAGPSGLIVGRSRSGAFVPVRVFRPEPTRVALVGGLWVARLLVFRCVGLGATVNVVTGNPSRWFGFGELAGAPDRVHLSAPARPAVSDGGPVAATASGAEPDPAGSLRPVVHVYDTGPTPPADRPRLGPWHTQLTVLPRLEPNGAPIVTEAHLTLMQRLSEQEATLCESILHQSADTTKRLQRLHDDMLAVIAPGSENYVWVGPTQIELELLGAPYKD